MIIKYGKSDWNINLFFIIMLAIFFTDRLLLDFIIPPEQPSSGTLGVLTGLSLLFSILIFPKLDKPLRIWLILIYIYLMFLFLESYFYYKTFTIYPHVFSKITEIFIVPFIYIFFYKYNQNDNSLKVIIYFITIVFIIHLIILKPFVFSFSSFLQEERGIGASSVFLMVLSAVYFFNKYMSKNKFITLLILLIILTLILFLQHRSVWLSTIVALIINLVLVKLKGNFNIKYSSIAFILIVPTIIVFIFSSLILSKNPEVYDKFKDRVEDIQKIQEQGTGSWRLKQTEAYMPFIENHLVFGMRFKGFELPVQFYEESSGNVYFEDGTGHHFHSFYIDVLFYLGLLGLFLKLFPVLYAIIIGLKKPTLNLEQITLISFICSYLIFGLAYSWSAVLYAFIGITLAKLLPSKNLSRETVNLEKQEVY